MRYFLITYIKKPNGQLDECTEVSRRLRTRDLQMCSVILDFQDQKVVTASLNGQSVPKVWDRVVEYYRPYYKDIFTQLETLHGHVDRLPES